MLKTFLKNIKFNFKSQNINKKILYRVIINNINISLLF